MRVLFNDFKKQAKTHKKRIHKAIQRVLDSGYFILGSQVKNFEDEFASYIGTKYVVGVANGLEALQISLMAIGLKKGDEVITTPHSAVATALAIVAAGAKPIFVDIDDFYHIDAQKIEKFITPKTKAIIPVHLYGQAANMKKISDIAKRYNLYVIEDCAQAHGAEYMGKKVGTYGITGCFSFYPTKNLGALGDAGAIVTNDNVIAEKCRMIRNYGQKNRYEHEVRGINSRLDELHASILREFLQNLDENNRKRVSMSKLYREELSNIKQIKLPKERSDSKHVYHLFVIETEKRDALQSFLKENGIDTLIHYPIPIHKQKCFSKYNEVSMPVTEKKAGQILSLPIHHYIEKKEVLYVCEKIRQFFKSP